MTPEPTTTADANLHLRRSVFSECIAEVLPKLWIKFREQNPGLKFTVSQMSFILSYRTLSTA